MPQLLKQREKVVISYDVESTGLDLHHGAQPFLVTTCDRHGHQRWWEWPVNPVTREVEVDYDEVLKIQELIDSADEVAMHNAKFDIRASATIGIHIPPEKVRCTLFGSHILASNHKHDLTSTVLEYLNHDIQPLEDRVREITKECRKRVRAGDWYHLGIETRHWRLADGDDPMMPSVDPGSSRDDDKPWKNDMWLMRALGAAVIKRPLSATEDGLSDLDRELLDQAEVPVEWLFVTQLYANGDSGVTLPLWLFMEAEIKRRGYWRVFLGRLPLVKIAADLEEARVTISGQQTDALLCEYGEVVDLCQAECHAIAEQLNFKLELPSGAAPNDSVREFFWGSVRLVCPRCGTETVHKHWINGPLNNNGDLECPKCLKRKAKPGPAVVKRQVIHNPCLALPLRYNEKSAGPSLDKDVLAEYEATLEPGIALDFIKSLTGMRSRQTAMTYMRSYKRFQLPVDSDRLPDWYRLASSVNPTGTDHLRWASYNPNSQNISKKESFNLRRCFGPMPGREWWSMDGKNLELRIPAYEAGETDLIWIFEHPDEPPYYGSYHLVVFDTLHPHLFAEHGKAVKELFESTWYQWVKNGNFACLYGAQRKKADATYHCVGAFDKISNRFTKMAALAEKYKGFANRYGYVETLPDRTVDPDRGYPILASRTEDGRISPTTPLNYHVSGTAMQWTNKAMIRTSGQMGQWQLGGWDGFITLQIHDELVFDCPAGTGPEPWLTNLPRMRVLQELMQRGGEDIGVPTPVSVEWHDVSWATGKTL